MMIIFNGLTANDAIYNGQSIDLYANGVNLIQHGFVDVNLNGQWVEETSDPVFDGYRLFKSNSNYHVHSSSAIMYASATKNDNFVMKYISDSEGAYDYLRIYNGYNTLIGSANGTSGKYTTLSNYSTYTTDAPADLMNINFVYRKDVSVHSNTDRAYVAIPTSAVRKIIP